MEEKKKVLLVDDDAFNGELLAKRLTKRGFEVIVLDRGEACLDYIVDHPVDIVLLDLVMPDMSGHEVLQCIRKIKGPVELPVIMVTFKDEATEIVAALKGGANDYLSKPVNIDVAEARILAQLEFRRLYNDSLFKKELETANALIVTYNHEINNPLAIALGDLAVLRRKGDLSAIDRIEESLKRIANIVKKIETVSKSGLQTEDYTSHTKYVKLS